MINAVLIYVTTITMAKFVIISLLVMFMLVFTQALPLYGDKIEEPIADQLAVRGIDVKQLEQVKKAAESEAQHIRILCIRYLASIKEEIASYLKDPNLPVRIKVAGLLADDGRDDGLSVMIKDYNELVYNGMDKDQETFLKLRDLITADRSLVHALEVGRVLAKLGDFRCLKLAELAITNASLEAQRYRAVWVLESFMTTARAAKEKAINSLIDSVEKEESSLVLKQIIGSMVRLGGVDALEVLSAIESTSRVPQVRDISSYAIKKIIDEENSGRIAPVNNP